MAYFWLVLPWPRCPSFLWGKVWTDNENLFQYMQWIKIRIESAVSAYIIPEVMTDWIKQRRRNSHRKKQKKNSTV